MVFDLIEWVHDELKKTESIVGLDLDFQTGQC